MIPNPSFSKARLVTLLLSAVVLLGQMNSAEISGTVKDSLGGVLPGATVVAEQAQTGLKFTARSNNAGQYVLAQLPIGVYTLRVNAPNFKQSALPGLEVHVGDILRHDFTVQLGDANQTIVIEADTGEPQLESGEIKDVLQNKQIVSLP